MYMNIHDDLPVEWADIDGQGLVRVYSTDSFKSGFALLALIGSVAEQLEYYPEVVLSSAKLTVTVPENDEGKDHQLVHAIESTLRNEITA